MATQPFFLLILLYFPSAISAIHPSIYGNDSGAFGVWNENNLYNLPSYTYQLNQITNPIAKMYNSSVEYQTWDHPLSNVTDHKFQFGNDRITVIASNYGYIQIRSDESSPKLLNDFNRNNNQYGSGCGYITNSNNKLLSSTFYTGNQNDIRDYSFFYRKYISNDINDNIIINQTIFAPFGSDPILISEIIIRSNININNLNYYQISGGAMYQLINSNPSTIRKYQIRNYNLKYSDININNTNGIYGVYNFNGTIQNITHVPNGSFWDENPPNLFLSTIGTHQQFTVNFGCNMDMFFGEFGVENPSFKLSECSSTSYSNMSSAGIVIKISDINLIANKEYKFYLIEGYIPNGYNINDIISKYNNNNLLNNLFANTALNWYNNAIKFNTSNYPEISREILWDYGLTRTSLSYYDLYSEYILDQGTWYRYVNGFQGAFRDPLQHLLPLIFTSSNIVKSIFRYQLKEIQQPFNSVTRYFNVPYALTGNGIIFNSTVSSAPSDLELYLLFSISEYILATKDIQFLYEIITLNVFSDDNNQQNINYTILECLMESYQYFRSHIGIGKHGVIRIQTGDWSDSFLSLSGANKTAIYEQGESGLNTAMATYVLPRFNEMLSMINESVVEIDEFAEYQKNVLRQVLWNGEWVNRAWVPNNYSADGEWLGSLQDDNRMHLFPQIWTILSNTLNKTETNILLNSINKRLRNYTNSIGSINVNPPYNQPYNTKNGTHENGGIWPAQNNPLVIALSKLDSNMAFDEWQKNSFARRSNVYPNFWPNIWSSSDVTSSYFVNKNSAIGTSNWPNFPILCTHAHSWPLYSLSTGLVGISFGANNVVIKPGLPQNNENSFGAFQFVTKLIEVHRDDKGNYYGIYKPKQFINDYFEVIIDLSVEKNVSFGIEHNEWTFKQIIKFKPFHTKKKTSIEWNFDVIERVLDVYARYE